MLCADPQLNQWDRVIGDVLGKGAKVTLSAQQLTLSGGDHTLVYTLRDWVQ
jgi:heat shock protein HslJ